jgi:diketogulonate reductase-like aldo/keto reductase
MEYGSIDHCNVLVDTAAAYKNERQVPKQFDASKASITVED